MLVNEQIRAPQVQLITQDGENVGIVTREAALLMAREAGLDLVTLSEDGREGIPVVKLLNVGKDLYEKKKKQAEAKKHQHVVQIKEIKIKPKIGEHDYQTKLKQAVKFLVEGKRLKMTLFFRGRENATKDERGAELFEKINKSFDEAGLGKYLVQERDSREGQTLSRMYHLKGYKAS